MAAPGTSGVATVAIKTYTNNIRRENAVPWNTATAIETLQDNVNSLNKAVGVFSSSITPGTNTDPNSLLQEISVPHSMTTNIAPSNAPQLRQRLTIVLLSDSTGGGLITWDATLIGPTPDDIDNSANARNLYEFIGLADGHWHMMSMLLGMP